MLASLLKLDEDAVICDLAEIYGIYDYKRLPATKVAIFVLGLRPNARIMLKASKSKLPLDSLLLAGILDRLSIILWQKTKDGQHNRNRPQSITDQLLGKDTHKRSEVAFESGIDFERERQRILGQIGGG